MVALGRDSPAVAPLRVELRPTPWLREAATSCGGRRRLLRLLRPCTIAERRVFSDLSVTGNAGLPVGSAHTQLAIKLRAFGHCECAWK